MHIRRFCKKYGLPIVVAVMLVVTVWKVIQPDAQMEKKSTVDHTLAVIVPFRDRFTNLLLFLPHMHNYLNRKGIPHTFYIINQSDDFRFNRGSLLNIGVKESDLMENHYFESTFSKWTMPLPPTQMIALHDVDLLPVSDSLNYQHSGKFPHHLIPYWMHPQYYNYPKYIGGAMIISRQSFNLVNGFSNRYWGWGREDDEFGLRLKEANLNVLYDRKPFTVTSKFQHLHSKLNKRERSPADLQVNVRRDHTSGLNTTKYTVLSRIKSEIANVIAWIINVKLECDVLVTPNCRSDL
nr:beta 14 galactosyltransferase 7 [Hymenolepis microstoma]